MIAQFFMAYIFIVKYSVLFGLFNFVLGLGLLNLASALTSASRLWPRPRPQDSGLGLDLGLKCVASASALASSVWPRPRPWPQVCGLGLGLDLGLDLGLKCVASASASASALASSTWPRLTSLLSVRLTHADIVSKRLYIYSKFFHRRVAPPFYSDGDPLTGASKKGV